MTLNIIYKRLPITAFLVEYIYDHLDNKNLLRGLVDMDTQSLFVGAKWDPTAKLSGHLKAGYYQTKLKASNNSSGFAMDTDLAYRLSDFTQLNLKAFRRIVRSIWAARESGEFYISTGGGLSASYRRWEPLTVTMDVSYANNRFKQRDILPLTKRTDDLFSAGLKAKYSIRKWLSFMVSYAYRRNNSTFDLDEYKENRIEARLAFVI